ncbi:tetratricopeptide repeat protein [candidate division WOR-3 bacterium]|nr:tetratricopeptide repeat protein [candidate division WOR-3 bacterium]
MVKIFKKSGFLPLFLFFVITCQTTGQVLNGSEGSLSDDEYGCKKFYNLAINYQRSRLWTEAIEFYEKAISCSTDYTEAYVGLGNLYEELDSMDAANSIWQTMMSEFPDKIETYIEYASYLSKNENFEESENMYKRAYTIDSTNSTAILGLADILTKQDKFSEALPYLETALGFTDDPAIVIALKQRMAKCYVGTGCPENAASLLEEILIAYPDRIEIHAWLADAYKGMHEYGKAIEHMEILIQSDSSLQRLMEFGSLLAVAGRTSEAISRFREAISKGGGLSAYKQVIGLLNNSGQTSLAMQFAQEALSSYSTDSYLNVLVGTKYQAAAVEAWNNQDWDDCIANCDVAIGYFTNATSGSYVTQAQQKLANVQQLREAARLKKIY